MQSDIYARFSGDNQREASIDDQVRNAYTIAEREGLSIRHTYSDRAISGTRTDRPDFNRLLRDAESGHVNVIIVDDLYRLSRAEDLPQIIARFKYWGVRVLSYDGFDSERDDSKIQTWTRGLIGNIYLDDLAKKTHRGLKGQALSGQSAGGKSYGYTSAPIYENEKIIGYQKKINAEQAEWVRYIFSRAADGITPRTIADELNRKGVASPRGSTWAHSAIYGDMKRATGMLNNPLYIGQYIWNRTKWVKDPMTGKRKQFQRPQSEWVIVDAPDLAIIQQETWNTVKARQRQQQHTTSTQRRRNNSHPGGGGRNKYLLSGLLKCGICGGSYIVADYYRYACATNKDRGSCACNNHIKVKRVLAEDILLKHIREELLSEQAFQFIAKEVTRLLEQEAPDCKQIERDIKKVDTEIQNIDRAIRSGIITITTKQSLIQAEEKRAMLLRELDAIKSIQPITMIPKLREHHSRAVGQLSKIKDIGKARESIRELIGEIKLYPHHEGKYLEAEIEKGRMATALCSMALVAGAGFEPTTFGL